MPTETAKPADSRKSFIRMVQLPFVKGLIKEARRVKYQVKTVPGFSYHVTDHSPEAMTPGAEVLRAIQVRPGIWAVSYSLDYWEEPALVLPATPANFAASMVQHP